VRSGTALSVIVVLVAALAAIATIHTPGLGRAETCADADGPQFATVGGCTELAAAAPFALLPPEYVPPPPELIPPPRENVPLPSLAPELIHPGPPPDPHQAPAWSTTDLKLGDRLPHGLYQKPGWPRTAYYEVGNYMSDNRQIFGLICYPWNESGQFPIFILNHGLNGLSANEFDGCTHLAAEGWFVATSTYRAGQAFSPTASPFPPDNNFTKTSQGSVPTGGIGNLWEFCGGEVNDVLRLVSIAKQFPEANQNQMLMWGHSHGSCITELAIERGAGPQIAVSIDGPTDFTHHSKTNFVPFPQPTPADWDQWGGTESFQTLQNDTGAASCDSCVQDQLKLRSSALNNPQALANSNVKFLRIQSEGDGVVLPENGCVLAAALGAGSSNSYYHLYPDSEPFPGIYVTPPKSCLPWLPTNCPWNYRGPVPCGPWKLGDPPEQFPDWPNSPTPWRSPTFLMYECSHSTCTDRSRIPQPLPFWPWQQAVVEHGAIIGESWSEVASFVNQFASAFGWSARFPTQAITL
jgi:hypothetical protein